MNCFINSNRYPREQRNKVYNMAVTSLLYR